MARNAALPIPTVEPGLTHYLEEIRRFPMLERQEEYMLARRWREHGDRDAAHKLVTSHLRLVTKSPGTIAATVWRSRRRSPRAILA